MINIINFVSKILEHIEKWLVIITFFLMAILSLFNVILRALYTKLDIEYANSILLSIDWSEPFSRLMVLWITFLGASILTKENRHIRIDLLGNILSPLLNTLREIILSIACTVVCSYMLYASIGYINMEIQYGTSLIMGVSAWKLQLIIPIGFCMMSFRFIFYLTQEMARLTGKKVQ